MHLNQDQIIKLVDSSDELNQEWKDHIESCQQCRLVYLEELRFNKILMGLPHHSPSDGFRQGVLLKVDQLSKITHSEDYWSSVISRSIPGAMILAVVMGLYMISLHDSAEVIQLDVISTWSQVILVVAIVAWLLYFMDQWLKKRYQGISYSTESKS